MTSDKFSEALGNLDDKYIEAAVNYKPRRKISLINGLGAAAACLCAVAAGAYLMNSNPPVSTGQLAPYSDDSSAAETVFVTEPVKEDIKPAPPSLLYSELVPDRKLTGISSGAESGCASFDIEAFSELDMRGCLAIVEGTVTEIKEMEYHYTTHSDKFEPDGILNHVENTVLYKIVVDKVWFGDAQPGDEILVEDSLFFCDEIGSVYEGGSFVIPLEYTGDKLWTYDDPIDGDVYRQTPYSTYYPFHPQIQRVEGGYIVPGDWESITADCSKVIMDIDTADPMIMYADELYYVPDDRFTDTMTEICDSIK